jgi:hypothetical protein
LISPADWSFNLQSAGEINLGENLDTVHIRWLVVRVAVRWLLDLENLAATSSQREAEDADTQVSTFNPEP